MITTTPASTMTPKSGVNNSSSSTIVSDESIRRRRSMSRHPLRARSVSLSQNRTGPIHLTRQQHFLVFVKILFQYLSYNNFDTRYVKSVVRKCMRSLQNNQSEQLVETLERELLKCVQEDQWQGALQCLALYSRKKGLKPARGDLIDNM